MASRPWEFVSQDLFKWKEVDDLGSDPTAPRVTEKSKAHFARFGIPDKVLIDNGPQYTSYEFSLFAKTYNFTHVTRSPYFEQSEGGGECKSGQIFSEMAHLQEALLDYCNTPQYGLSYSRAQRMLCRHTRTSACL